MPEMTLNPPARSTWFELANYELDCLRLDLARRTAHVRSARSSADETHYRQLVACLRIAELDFRQQLAHIGGFATGRVDASASPIFQHHLINEEVPF